MTRVFHLDFTGATDPDLTPNPFTSMTENAGNDAKYTATGGKDGGPGMELDYAGAASACNGEMVHASILPGSQTPFAAFDVAIVVTGMSLGLITDLWRARLDTTVVAKIRIVGQTITTTYRISVEDMIGTGGAVESATLFTAGATFHRVRLEMKGSTNQLLLYVDDVLEATCSVGSALSAWDRENWGGSSGSNPGAAASWFYDNLELDDGDEAGPGTGAASSVSGHSPLSLGLGLSHR